MSSFAPSLCLPMEMGAGPAVSTACAGGAPPGLLQGSMQQALLLPSGFPLGMPSWGQLDANGLPLLPQPGGACPYPLEQLAAQPMPQVHLMQQQGPTGTTVFFAGVTPIVAPEALLSVFAQFGRVMDLNLFRPYKGCRTSKGCGLVVFSQPGEAAAALEALHGRFVWPGARSPMVIEWCDPTKQHKRKRAQPLAPALLQQVLAYQQQAVPCMPPMMPPTSISLGYMHAGGNAGRLMMPGY